MSLWDKLNDLKQGEWLYYRNNNAFYRKFHNFSCAYKKPFEFVQEYFDLGGKINFLPETIFSCQNSEKNRKEYEFRAKHVVSTFFLGIYLHKKIEVLQPSKNSFMLEDNGRNFLWAWFLCSLYHDAYYNLENESKLDDEDKRLLERVQNCEFNYCNFSKFLLYREEVLRKYYLKNQKGKASDPEKYTSYDGKIYFDHGILGAESLYKNYVKGIEHALQNENNKIEDFFTDTGITINEGRLKLNCEHFIAVCNIAKIIASHNIRVCDNNLIDNDGRKDTDKYRDAGLKVLIPTLSQNSAMPNYHFGILNDYEKLYYLLALVDSLEPTKREIQLKNVDIDIVSIDNQIYSIQIKYKKFKEPKVSCIEKMPTWLKFITVRKNEKRDGFIITLDFNDIRIKK